MNNELDKKLVEDFPKIFRDRNADMTASCMCWGFECGDGWYDLLHTLCTNIQNHLNEHPEIPQVIATQVKEKFGGLRFYVQGGDDTTYQFISDAETQSYKTCEVCGSTINVKQTKKGWITTLCEKHYPKPQ